MTKASQVKDYAELIEELATRIQYLEDLVKKLLDPKDKELETSESKIDGLCNKTTDLETVGKIVYFHCRECDKSFLNKRSLRLHFNEIHIKSFKCTSCDKIFDARWKLEMHIETDHETSKEFKCDLCDQEFHLKWRLNQHIKGHKEEKGKFCHYFNNSEICLYERVGCMFRHDIAPSCIFGKSCNNKLLIMPI